MAYEFKNLNEIPVQDVPTENITVMAFKSGNPKQIPAGEFGAGTVLIDIPNDDPGWNSNNFDFNYDPIYEALMENKTVILRSPYEDGDIMCEWRALAVNWWLQPNEGYILGLADIVIIGVSPTAPTTLPREVIAYVS